MRTNFIAELIKLAGDADLGDDKTLDLIGQCVLVCTLLDPATAPDLKKKVAKRLSDYAAPRDADARSATP